MKKLFSVFILLVVCLSAVFSLSACSNKNDIVGTWKFSSIDMSYGDNIMDIRFDTDSVLTFFDDGTCTNKYEETCYWKYDKDNKEYILADDTGDFDTDDVERAYIDKDNVLHIDGKTYKRQAD